MGTRGRWRVALTERISASEVVIRDRQPIAMPGSVSVEVALPSTRTYRGGCLVASGQLKRSRARAGGSGACTFVVSVRRSRLELGARVFAASG